MRCSRMKRGWYPSFTTLLSIASNSAALVYVPTNVLYIESQSCLFRPVFSGRDFTPNFRVTGGDVFRCVACPELHQCLGHVCQLEVGDAETAQRVETFDAQRLEL